MKIVRATILVASIVSLSACATVTRGTKQKFWVMSEPEAASVEMTNGQKCTTPCEFKLKRKDEFSVTVSKDGYKPITVPIESKMGGGGTAGAAGNVLAGGIIGIVVDGSNGSLNDLKPNPLKVIMAAADSADESKIVEADKPKKGKRGKKEKAASK